jgi:hypothetical protein
MTKNRAKHKISDLPITAQGVRDLNLIGPRKPRTPSDPSVQELRLNERTCGGGGGHPERPLVGDEKLF